eukprot:scaffold1120_cov127-Cylindrotheca_fusiformis.AAC.17
MRRTTTSIPKRLVAQKIRRIHHQNRLSNTGQECVNVASIQKRSIWPFSDSDTKSQSEEVSIHMPKKNVAQQKENTYKEQIDSILRSPIGSIRPSTWLHAETIIEHITEQEKIPEAFRVLDRLAKEPDSKSKMNNDSIFTVVNKWFSITQQQKGFSYPQLKVWQKLEEYQKAGISIDSRTYHRLIEALAIGKYTKPNNRYGPIGPVLAETILERMMTLSEHENPAVRPSTYTFNAVLSAWNNAGSKSTWAKNEAPQRCLALLNKLKMLHESGWGSELMPDKNTYRRVMNVYAHRGDGDQVEALLEELYERYVEEGRPGELLPTKAFFSLVLFAWSKSNDPAAAERASVILERMLELESSMEIPGLEVNAACFNIVMICFSRQRTKESAIDAQNLFDRMVELSKTDDAKKPIGGSYTALIGNWAHYDAARAEELFWRWKDEHEKGNVEMRLDDRLLGTLVASCYKSKSITDNAERCDRLLQYALNAGLKSFQPSVVLFNMTINAYCRKKTVEGVEHAEKLLRQMEDYKDLLMPTSFSYVPIINTWASLGRIERAEEFLLEWFSSSNRDKISSDSPSMKVKKRLDLHTFNQVLKAWSLKARAKPEAAKRAEQLLLTMRRLGIRANATSFQLVLQCRKRSLQNSNGDLEDPSPVDEILDFLNKEYKLHSHIKKDSYMQLHQDWSMLSLKQK